MRKHSYNDISYKEIDKIVHSFVRFLIGSKKCTYFVQSRKIPERIKLHYLSYRGKNTCPFCGKKFGLKGALASHLLSEHYDQIVEILF